MAELRDYSVVLSTSRAEDIRAERVSVEPTGALVFRTEDRIVRAYAPFLWVQFSELPPAPTEDAA